MSVQIDRNVHIDYGDPARTGGVSIFAPEFDDHFFYNGDDLGVRYSKDCCAFRLWAPTASEAFVVLYRTWDGRSDRLFPMTEDVQGTWTLKVNEDLKGYLYTYLVRIGDQWNEAADPYATAVAVNGDRAAIIDLAGTNPDRWTEDKPVFNKVTDAIIYEAHIRDFSIHPESGISHKGKYLGMTETGTRGPEGIKTGLDHILSLGVTHVQLLPFYDYSTESVDETRLDTPQYNWGYDPKNYNVPEGSYSTDPYQPEVRIRELKQLIQTLHDQGLRVIMDVVYNHVYDGYVVNFTKLVPGYYLRYNSQQEFSNGSGCGNDVASERKMMTKFIVESVLHWAKEYHVDGFRFDLMGLLDVDTMNEIRRRLDEIDPSLVTIGEGWIMETELPSHKRANQNQASQMPGIAFFNDVIRDAIRGHVFEAREKGFVSGGVGLEHAIKQGVTACIDFDDWIKGYAAEPTQTVTYAECHDNHTLWDKILVSVDGQENEIRRQMHRLGSSIVLTSQGIAFIHAGQEFCRSKVGFENSYNLPDEVNRLDWERCAEYRDDVEFMKELIKLRKEHPAFRLESSELIRKHLRFEASPSNTVAYTLRNHAGEDSAEHLYVVYNARRDKVSLQLPALGEWTILHGQERVRSVNSDMLEVEGIGMVVLAV
ncbi:type I pullulanase [Paenibacillus zeisoli]|uniref:Type I pullulanase n=1 Tax=Paenibacillus zeisoli TaxID=2496267 RepID=A0A3S1D867_9BACL|nr:type I pullulanase [Paenibacillus zeisoli]RUT29913.1 type I pullulanase [Paenibacillus zeisoli]